MKQQIIPLGDACEVFNGKTPSRAEQRIQGFPILKIKDIDELGLFRGQYTSFVDEKFYKSHNDKIVQEDDILILNAAHNSDYVGSKKFIASKDIEGTIATGEWLIIRSNDKSINPHYLFYWLASEFGKQSLKAIVRGIHLYPKDVKKLRIPLIEIQLQNKVVEDMKIVETIYSKRKLSIKKLDELLQSVFHDMFGDIANNKSNYRKAKIGDLTKVSSGGTPSRKNPEYFNGNIPWVKTTEVNGQIIRDTEEKITELGLENSSCKLYPPKSVIVAMYGQGKTRGKVGILGIKATTNQACAVILPSNKLDYLFLYSYLLYSYDMLRGLGRGGNQPNLNAGMISNLEIPVPPDDLQKKFADIFIEINRQKEVMNQELNKMEDLFQSLSNQSFNSETKQYAN